jgi:ATP-dependent RNA helicase DeaD
MTTPLFSELDLSPEILQALTVMGFEAPTPIQHECIPALREGRDVLGQAQTGTGKTAAFGIPALEHIDVENRNVQVLVLCPTRELAIQITGELMKLGQFKKGIHIVPVYGGQPIDRQLKALKRATHIVVGTPGRVIDHLERRTLDISKLSMFVLDEADEMLNMGFREDIENISKYCAKKPQTVMFSATVSAPIRDIINRQMVDPLTIRIDRTVTTAPNIEQFIVEVRDSMRTEAISRIMDVKNFKLGLIFTNTKMQADILVQDLGARGYDCDVLHGDMKQSQRDTVMGKFRRGDLDLLIATDVAARGIDVDDIDVVFNYDIPNDPEYYVHRIGRTGRAGRSGTAITFAAGFRNRRVGFIEKMVKTTLKPMTLPSVKEVEASRANEFIGQIRATLEGGALRPYIEMIEAMGETTYSPIEIAAACLKMQVALKPEQAKEFEAPRFDRGDRSERFERGGRERGSDRGDRGSDRGPSRGRDRGAMEAGMTRLFVNVGKTHNVRPGDIVGAIAGETGLSGGQIGQISLQQNFSLVDVPSDEAQTVISKMNRAKIKGNKVVMRLDRA